MAKRFWWMIAEGLGKFDGIYFGDMRLFEVPKLSFEGLKVLPIDGNKFYLEFDGRVIGIVERRILWNFEKLGIEWKLKTFSNVDITPKVTLNPLPADLMKLRGFGGEEVRIESERNTHHFKSKGMDLILKTESNFTDEGNGWKLRFEIEIEDLKARGIQKKIFEKATFDSWDDYPAIEGIEDLLVPTPFGALPVAGLPWYSSLFGRDLLIFALQILNLKPKIVERILRAVGEFLGKKVDRKTDEEPGKVFHEIRIGPSGIVYYGSVDSTPLYLLTVSEYMKVSRDWDFIESMKEKIIGAVEWVLDWGDSDGDGYLDYRTEGWLRNKGWKDSDDSVVFSSGEIAEGPIALIEVQSYAYAACTGISEILRRIDRSELSQECESLSEWVKENLERDFSIGDYFAIALDGSGKKVDSITSNPAHALFSGVFSKKAARSIVERIFKEDMLTPYGIRTMSSKEKAYSPVSYHNGSIWPHDNWFIVRGLMKYGFVDEARELIRRMKLAKEKLGGMPELFVYVDGFDDPLPYPGACSPQLWALGSDLAFEKLYEEVGL